VAGMSTASASGILLMFPLPLPLSLPLPLPPLLYACWAVGTTSVINAISICCCGAHSSLCLRRVASQGEKPFAGAESVADFVHTRGGGRVSWQARW